MSSNIILVGLMGCGKTTVAKCFAEKYGYNFVDFDLQIEKQEGMKISEIFQRKGEEYFRTLEKKFIQSVDFEKSIIATGGGIVEDVENIDNLKQIGKVVYLEASPKIIFERIKNETHRPLLNVQNPLGELEKIYRKRCGKYELADHKVGTEGKSIEEILKEIYEKTHG